LRPSAYVYREDTQWCTAAAHCWSMIVIAVMAVVVVIVGH
jgi:hypothetical protein